MQLTNVRIRDILLARKIVRPRQQRLTGKCAKKHSRARCVGRAVQQQGTPDQPQMAVRLRMVAQPALGLRVILLGQQTGRAGAVQHLVEQLLGVEGLDLDAALPFGGLDGDRAAVRQTRLNS